MPYSPIRKEGSKWVFKAYNSGRIYHFRRKRDAEKIRGMLMEKYASEMERPRRLGNAGVVGRKRMIGHWRRMRA
jgi:hypothetical protein